MTERSSVWQQEWATFRRLLTYAWPYRSRLVIGIVFGMAFGFSHLGLLSAFHHLVNKAFVEEASWTAVLLVSGAMPLVGLVRGVGQYISQYYIAWVGNRVVMDLRIAVFSHMQGLSVQYFSASRTGDLISRVINDSTQVEHAVSHVIGELIRQPVVLVCAVGYLFWLDPLLAGASFILFPVCVLPTALFGRLVRRNMRRAQERLSDLVFILQETSIGVRIVKAFGMEEYETSRFREECGQFFQRMMRVQKARAGIDPLVVFISMFGVSLAFLYARYRGMNVAELFTFAIAMVMLYDPVRKLSRVHLNIQQSSAAADRIFEVLDAEVSVSQAPDAKPFEGAVRRVSFRELAFSYGEGPVLEDIDFDVPAGSTVAIVGTSGSGKSTLVNLIPRFYDPTRGAVLINGQDIRELTIPSLRRQVGIVTQDTVLFNDTVANNISYGHPEAPRKEIEAAARRANAHAFIEAMPKGYDTIVGEHGVRLSGGQCQRLAIARAVLRNSPILVLDEATSALDTESERLVQAALDDLMADRTVFVIAHRLSTVTAADRILVLDNGHIVQDGTHAQLMQEEGLYKHLYTLQFEHAG